MPLALFLVALVLSIIELIRSRGQSLLAWAVCALAAAWAVPALKAWL